MPYKKDHVVYMEYDGEVRKAIITDIFLDRDQFDDRRPKYRIHLANKKGDTFAKNWLYTWPGFIQRGYKKMKELTTCTT